MLHCFLSQNPKILFPPTACSYSEMSFVLERTRFSLLPTLAGPVLPVAAFHENHNDRAKRRKIVKKDKEYGISRGIDFQNVACVLNFDLPASP